MNLAPESSELMDAKKPVVSDFTDAAPHERIHASGEAHRLIDKDALTSLPPPGGRHSAAVYVEYCCPGCGTLLDVESRCPAVEGEKVEPIWDIEIAPAALAKAAHAALRTAEAAE